MKSARELFEELGYKKLPKKYNKNMILYENEINIIGSVRPRKELKIIYFSLTDKRIQFSPYFKYSMQELNAINQQINELGWNDTTLNLDVKLDGKKVMEAMRGGNRKD